MGGFHDPDPPDIRTQRSDVPAPVAAAIQRCLKKTPADRWTSAMAAVGGGEKDPLVRQGGLARRGILERGQ